MSAKWPILVAIVLGGVVLAGCKESAKEPADASNNKPNERELVPTPPQPPNNTANQPIPGAMDDKDSTDPRVTDKFPKSGTVGQWKKVKQVTLYPADKLGDMDENVAGYRPYGVDWAADVIYQRGEQAGQRVFVQLFHCGSGKDAFGLMTAMASATASPQGNRYGAGTEALGDDLRVDINKGEYLLSVWSAEQQPGGFGDSMTQLARSIAEKLPAVRGVIRPDLVAALPSAGLGEPVVQYHRGGLWLNTRHPGVAQIARVDAEDELVIADYGYRPTADAAAQLLQIFVIRYSDEAEAKDAHDRLLTLQKEAKPGLGVQLVIGETVKGRCVYGTLTGDVYGVMESWVYREHADDAMKYPVMPTLEAVLP